MKSKFLIGGGVLLLAASLCLTIYNFNEDKQAGESVEEILRQYKVLCSSPEGKDAGSEEAGEGEDAGISEEQIYSGDSEEEMPAVAVNEALYIGLLEIPALKLTLPIMGEWSYAELKNSPCRYKGSVYKDNMIIAGHNYKNHFGGLSELKEDDEIIFTDVEGEQFEYRVKEVTSVDGGDVEEMETGDWDLTLFTCTLDGQNRVTVRCSRRENSDN